jgi:Pertussis toxin, subunit 1
VGLAVGAGVISAPAVAVIGGALLLYSAGSSLFRRSEQARASGNDNLGEIAGATALDTFGFGGLVEGVRGRELVTGRCLNGNERSQGIGQGIGNAIAFAGGPKVFKSAYNQSYPLRAVPQNQLLRRGDSRSPEQIFDEGFQPQGNNRNLLTYARDNVPSVYVGTSRSNSVAADFATKYGTRDGYIYTVNPPRGIDVNRNLGSKSPFPLEQEIAIPGGIKPENIVGATPINSFGELGNFSVLNPNYFRRS